MSLRLMVARKVATKVYSNAAPAVLPQRDSQTTLVVIVNNH